MWKRRVEKGFKPHASQIIRKLERMHKKKFPVNSFYIFFTSFPRNPYGGSEKTFWIQIYMHSKNPLNSIVHELMHLFFHEYYWKKCEKEGLTNEQIHNIKEAFTILINAEFKDLKLKDRGYDSHQKLREFIKKEWKRTRDFNKVLKQTILYYKKCLQ